MDDLLVSFADENIRFLHKAWLFRRRQRLRFEWLALLAYHRVTAPVDSPGVTLEEVAKLPKWKGKPIRHIATYLGRYLQSREIAAVDLATATELWAGPYKLNVDPLKIRFDIPLNEVRKRLHLRSTPIYATNRDDLLAFTLGYVRAQWLFAQGRLNPGAYQAYMRMTGESRFGSTLQLLARVSAVDVLFRRGAFKVARESLLQSKRLMHDCPMLSLKARYELAMAWARQRSSTGESSDRAVEACLRRAASYAENSGDRSAIGLFSYRKAWYLTKRRRYQDAVMEFATALESYLIVGNYYSIQATCSGLGSVLHRIGPMAYPEARRWLLASIAIARLMRVGREDAHSEMILGKIYVELNKQTLSQLMLKRAERIARKAGNRVNLADIKMVCGFWFQRYGSKSELIETLVEALRGFRAMAEFDVAQKEKYMSTRFREVWEDVLQNS